MKAGARIAEPQQLDQDGGGYAIRQVPHHSRGRDQLCQLVNVDLQEIRLDDRHVRGSGGLELLDETGIDLDRCDVSNPSGELDGQGPAAGTDLKKRVCWSWIDRVDELRDPGRPPRSAGRTDGWVESPARPGAGATSGDPVLARRPGRGRRGSHNRSLPHNGRRAGEACRSSAMQN